MKERMNEQRNERTNERMNALPPTQNATVGHHGDIVTSQSHNTVLM